MVWCFAIPRVAGGKRVGNESLAAAGGNEWLRALGILASGPLGQSEAGPCEALLLTKHCAIGAVSPPSLVTSPTLPATLLVTVSYVLGSITMNKASGGYGIPVELFQILKDNAVKVLHSICQEIWKTQQWPQDWKRPVFIPIPKKGNAKECSNYHTIALISHASKIMLKTLQTRLQQYMNRELADVQTGFRKGRGTRDQIANICWIIKKAREFQRNM